MNLVEKMKEDFVFINKITITGPFGTETKWEDGEHFSAAIVYQSSTDARIAEVEHNIANWEITTDINIELKEEDIIKRSATGKVFEISQPNEDLQTPTIATFKFRKAFAKEFDLFSAMKKTQSANTK